MNRIIICKRDSVARGIAHFVVLALITVYFTKGLFQIPLPQGSDALTWSVTQFYDARHDWLAPGWVGVNSPGGPAQITILDTLLTMIYLIFPSPLVPKIL